MIGEHGGTHSEERGEGVCEGRGGGVAGGAKGSHNVQ